MNHEIESQLEALFRNAGEDLPPGEFVAGVIARIRRREARDRFRMYAAGGAMMGFLWLLSPDVAAVALDTGVRSVGLLAAGSEWVAALASSPLAHVYGGAFGAYLLLRILVRFRVRFV